MSILGKIFGEGLEGAGENAARKAAKEAAESTLSKIGKKIPVSYTDNVAQDIAVKAPEMVQVYRGMAAKTDDELKKYLSDMVDYNIKPRTYSGLNVSGEGYNFTTNPVAATKYANTNPVKESRVVLTTELPKNRFIQQNAANQNRLQDFISRAESRGIPYEGGASERAAKKDMEAYFKKNGLLGVRNNSGQIFVVNQNDPEWIDKLAVDKAMRGRRSDIVEDMELKNDLGSILKTADVQNDLDNAKKYIPVMADDAAQNIPVYTKDDFITDPSIFDDPAFADIVKNNNVENVMNKATKSDLELVKRAKAGEVLTEDEIRNSRFAKNLGIDAKRAQLKYGNKLNITKAMEEGTEKVPEELDKRLRGMADTVLDRLHKDPNIKYDRKAVIFMGGPSSGKSSAGMKLYDAAKGGDYAVIDSDDIKPMFEEFGKGEGAGAVHLASAYTAKNMVLPDAAAEGMNLALPIVGKSDNALNYHLNLLKNAGYDVSVVDVSLPTEKAASRNFGRMMETNRNVEDTYVRDVVGQKPAEVYKRMVENVKAGKDKRVSGYAKISNDVKFGEPQILEEISPSNVLKRVQDKFGKNKDFGESVIVDKKGDLLDLYHGTDASFDKFGDIKTEPGYWFTEDKKYAQSHGKNLMTVNLDIRNPIDMTTADGENLLYDLARERFGIKGVVPEDKIFSKDFREFLQSKGYDGLIWDKDGKNTYVAFRPDQIKIRNK